MPPRTLAQRLSAHNRDRKWRLFLQEITPTESMRILDVGYSAKEFSQVDNYIEKHYPFPWRLTALGIDPVQEFSDRYQGVHTVSYDGGIFPFTDKQFDVVWSNAVLEHVGGTDKQLLFLKEIARVGRRAFITTPNRYFPIELHTRTPLLHYFPKPVLDAYLTAVGKSWATADYMHLLSERELRVLLSAAGITRYRLFRNRLFGLAVDFAVVTAFDSAAMR